jgi:hypothetical protein
MMARLDHNPPLAPPARARRRDHGAIRVTSRDLAVITWIAEQYAAPVESIALLLGDVSRSSVQRWIERMRRHAWVRTQMLLGRMWVWPTTVALQACGYGAWRSRAPVVIRLDHLDAVGRVRLWYARTMPDTLWISERRLADWSTADAVTPDGALYRDGAPIAVQVERTMRPATQYAHIIQALHARYQRIVYVCADAIRRPLTDRLVASATAMAPLDMLSLDVVLAETTPTYKRAAR